jgi:hypothetical protein
MARAMADLINAQISTFPTTSSSAAFSYSFNRRLGIVEPNSQSFGSSFTERALTAGRRQLSALVTYQRTRWSSIDDFSLDTGLTNVGNLFAPTDTVIAHLSTSTLSVGVTYGLTDRIDVSATVPIAHASLSGQHSSSFFTDTGALLTFTFGGASSATGLGDVNLHVKLNLRNHGRTQFATTGDVWLGTGDPSAFTGLGKTRARVAAIVTNTFGPVTPHCSFGYTFAGSGIVFHPSGFAGPVPGTEVVGFSKEQSAFDLSPNNEVNYSAGLDAAVTPKITLAIDVIARSVVHSARLVVLDNSGQIPNDGFQPATAFFFKSTTLNLATAAVGAKINVAGRWVLSMNMLLPMTSSGARPSVTPVIGFERAF